MQETDAEQQTVQSKPHCSPSDDHILIDERKWEDITANEYSHKNELGYFSQNLLESWYVTNIAVTEADGATYWRLMSQKLKCAFLHHGRDTFTDRDCISHIWKGSSKTRFQYCQNCCNTLLCTRAIQGHIEGDVIELELMGVAILFKLKINLGGGAHRRRKSREGRQGEGTPLGPWGRLKNNSKVSCRNQGRHTFRLGGSALAVCKTHLAKTQEEGVTFWQTKSNAIIAYKTVPLDSIERVISQKGETTSKSTTLYTTASSKNNSRKCLDLAAAG